MSNSDTTSSEPASSPAPQAGDVDISPSRPRETKQLPARPQTFAPQPLSEYQQVVLGSTGQTLPIFGANLFNAVP
ncbi:MAG TPA: hypothetical protein VGU23_10780, partial [Acidobacteriaceae bacterium]|nr:hypothetical protein [Acidobacteriaceae bacterium]